MSKSVTCKYCGAFGLDWIKLKAENRWALADGAELHKCADRKTAAEILQHQARVMAATRPEPEIAAYLRRVPETSIRNGWRPPKAQNLGSDGAAQRLIPGNAGPVDHDRSQSLPRRGQQPGSPSDGNHKPAP